MISELKMRLYFVVAAYFAFWAKFVLRRWRPRIVVVTGSSGKTTVLHMIEAQLGDKAVYSHHANSAIGLPFHILGLNPNVTSKQGWVKQLILAPFQIGRSLPTSKLYVVEADTDRPHEGKFLSRLLRPEVTLWVSVYRTHSMNFDKVVGPGKFPTHEEAIAYEFGHFAEQTQKLVLAGDQPELGKQLERVPESVEVKQTNSDALTDYRVSGDKTTYTINSQNFELKGLHPKELGVGLQMIGSLLDYLGEPMDTSFSQLHMPPGRSSVFKGKNDLTIVDSTYNTGLGAMTAIVHLFRNYPAKQKWLVLGDILEQGSLEQQEHEGLAHLIADNPADQVVLIGPRTQKYTLPLLQQLKPEQPVVAFEGPKEVLDFLQTHLSGGEAVLFKGARGLEGVIEQLLADPSDASKLVRREAKWTAYRRKWGLPQ